MYGHLTTRKLTRHQQITLKYISNRFGVWNFDQSPFHLFRILMRLFKIIKLSSVLGGNFISWQGGLVPRWPDTWHRISVFSLARTSFHSQQKRQSNPQNFHWTAGPPGSFHNVPPGWLPLDPAYECCSESEEEAEAILYGHYHTEAANTVYRNVCGFSLSAL